MSIVHVCRTSQESVLRQFAAKRLGLEKVALMSDSEILAWFESEKYQLYIEYTGQYDDSDDVLIAKPRDIEKLVSDGKAFWATRSGRLEEWVNSRVFKNGLKDAKLRSSMKSCAAMPHRSWLL